MRIISGQFRSRPIKSLPGYDIRPTSDRLRETLFNVLTSGNPAALENKVFVDLYAGTGAVGIEALSRGAANVYFVESSKKAANLKKLEDLKGKTVVSTSGTTNIKQITELNTEKNLGLNILPAKDHAEAFLMVETGRAAAFVMDDILLYSLVAGSKAPKDYEISTDALSVEPYGIMLRKDDPTFKKVVDDAMVAVYKGGEINKIYDKWFLNAIPPKGINLEVPMSAAFKQVIAKPTDSGDPKDYQ